MWHGTTFDIVSVAVPADVDNHISCFLNVLFKHIFKQAGTIFY